jgi:hypothetical protein
MRPRRWRETNATRSAASVGKSRAAVLSQAGAPLSWTSERADTFSVCEESAEGSGSQAPASASEASNVYGESGGAFSSASDDEVGGLSARLCEQL